MNRLTGIAAVAALAALLAGCNTVKGVGKDIEALGKGVAQGSQTVEDEITGRK